MSRGGETPGPTPPVVEPTAQLYVRTGSGSSAVDRLAVAGELLSADEKLRLVYNTDISVSWNADFELELAGITGGSILVNFVSEDELYYVEFGGGSGADSFSYNGAPSGAKLPNITFTYEGLAADKRVPISVDYMLVT